MEKKTPLYDRHVTALGKIVPFAGWLLPVQYSGVIAEHMAVRQACGLFDVSHMGELVLRGADALANVNRLMTNDFTGMYAGQARYSPMCYENGGVVDDLIVYKCTDTAYLIVVNAANKDKDAAWIAAHLTGACTMEDRSDSIAQLALQGPRAQAILRPLAGELPEKSYSAVLQGAVDGIPCLISRTGYTGEDGFELYCASGDAPLLYGGLPDPAGRPVQERDHSDSPGGSGQRGEDLPPGVDHPRRRHRRIPGLLLCPSSAAMTAVSCPSGNP